MTINLHIPIYDQKNRLRHSVKHPFVGLKCSTLQCTNFIHLNALQNFNSEDFAAQKVVYEKIWLANNLSYDKRPHIQRWRVILVHE